MCSGPEPLASARGPKDARDEPPRRGVVCQADEPPLMLSAALQLPLSAESCEPREVRSTGGLSLRSVDERHAREVAMAEEAPLDGRAASGWPARGPASEPALDQVRAVAALAPSRTSWSSARSESAVEGPAPPPVRSRAPLGRARRGRMSSIPGSASATGRRRLCGSSLSRSRVRASWPETADESWCVMSVEHGGDRVGPDRGLSVPHPQAITQARTVAGPSRQP
jgi:hypothetical protein